MKISLIIIVALVLLAPESVSAQRSMAAEREWKPFFSAFRAAVKKRDRQAVKKMMSRDFHFSGGGGDDNHDRDSRDEAFEFWDDPHVRGWRALDKVLARGTVPMARWWDGGQRRKYVSRVGPPAANSRRVINRTGIEWYAIFEYRDGRWYCTIFKQCCD